MNPTDLVAPAVVIGLGIGIMQMLKYADTYNVFKRFYPLASFIIGIILSILFHFSLLVILTTSLAIAGVYDGWTYTVMGKGQNNTEDVSPTAPSNVNNP